MLKSAAKSVLWHSVLYHTRPQGLFPDVRAASAYLAANKFLCRQPRMLKRQEPLERGWSYM